ncbi:PDCD2-C domain-containing protein [Pyrenophora tritici-repentis]|nr:PDCD2-C domain-containing protein [Pyrenophora tritici-repentis]
MAPYDSDSSDGRDDYTETNVLLGYATKDATGDAISHVGGAPNWIDDKTAPSGALPNGQRVTVWRQEWRKRVHPSKPLSNPFASKPNGANPFSQSGSTNPFGAATPAPAVQITQPEKKEDEASTTLPETFAAKARIAAPSPSEQQPPRPYEPWPADSAFPTPFPHYHLDAEYETLDAPSTPSIPANARMDIDTEGGGSGGGKEDKEVFESSMDRTFQKFADRVGENAEQVLRYEFKGKPLLYSDKDAVGKLLGPHSENGASSNSNVTTVGSRSGSGYPRCQTCGADRVFEVQLTPHAITELEAEEMSIDGMEWGTIIMAVCSKDCKPNDVPEGEVGYVEEWVGVQWEEVPSKK